MSQELLIGILPPTGWMLWWMSGRGILGVKIWRRELWPAIAALTALLCGMAWWRVLVGFALMDAVHRLPISNGFHRDADEPSLPWLLVLSFLIGFCTIWSGTWWGWCAITSGWFLAMSIASLGHESVTWSLVESSTGLCQGVALVNGFTGLVG